MMIANIYALHSLQYNNNIDYIIHTPSLLQYEIMYLVYYIVTGTIRGCILVHVLQAECQGSTGYDRGLDFLEYRYFQIA